MFSSTVLVKGIAKNFKFFNIADSTSQVKEKREMGRS
jgi:hypothetical protein